MRLALPALAAVLLTACATTPRTPAPQVPSAESTTLIEGHAFHLERMRVPAGATLDVQLIDNALADALPVSATPAATIARQRYEISGSSPYAFALPVASARIVAGARYSLRASLRDARGHLLFATAARVALTPAARLELRLVRAAPDREPAPR